MSFREKSAWIALVSISLIYGNYFWSISNASLHGSEFHFGGLLATIIMLVIVQAVLFAGAAIISPKDAQAPRDEREKLIDLRSTRVAYAGLATGIAVACLLGTFDPPITYNTNGLLFILVTAELIRSGYQIIQYRRGA